MTADTASRTVPAVRPDQGGRPGWVTPALVIGLLLAVTLAATLLGRGGKGNTDDLDPANPGRTGAQGLARVLTGHGVAVTVVRSQRELLDQSIGTSSTVVVTGTSQLSGRTARAARSHAASAAGLVLLDADTEVTKGLGLPVEPHRAALRKVAAGCQGAAVGESFRLAQADRAYTLTTTASGALTCFPDKSGGGAAMVTLPGGLSGPPVTLIGDSSLVTNGAILDSDNAAIALRLLGQSNRLIWYVPSRADIAASDGSSRSIAPQWFRPGLVLATSAVLFLCLWRGRRLGRLVTEPLPVIVRAAETTESRGRMYRRSRDRTRALTVLQVATRRRLAAYLGLSVSTGTSNVAAAAAAVSGRDYQEVLDLLSSSEAPDDSSLLAHANTLTALEKEVRRP